MHVKFLDLFSTTDPVKKQYIKEVEGLIDRHSFILTEEVAKFEQEWAKAIGTKYAVGVSCGADALYLSLISANVGPGDEVITQGNAYNASVTAILRTGAKARFADIDPKTLCMDATRVEALINKKTKAILPVHLYGMANNMEQIMQIAKKNNLAVIEDCAQAHLAEYNGKKVGSFGIGAFSFYPTKNLGAFGDAGAITMNEKKIYDEIKVRRNLGQTKKNDHQLLGFNTRLDPIQAVVLSLKLRFLEKWTKSRQEAGKYYNKLIKQANLKIFAQEILPKASHVYHLYVIQSPEYDRDKLHNKLLEFGVETGVYYPVPVYRQPFYRQKFDPCPITDKVCSQILCLPMYSGISKREQEYVIASIKKILK